MVLNFRQWELVTLLLLPLGLAACGTGNDFAEPIKAFSAATTKAGETFADASKELDRLSIEQRLRLASENPASLRPKRDLAKPEKDDCGLESERCRLEFIIRKDANGNQNTSALLDPGPAVPLISAIMAGIATYGEALAEIASADLDGQVKSGFDKLKGSALGLIENTDKLAEQQKLPGLTNAGKSVKALTDPIAGIGAVVFGAVLENRKREILRKAVAAMEDDFPQMVSVLAAVAKTGYDGRRIRALDTFELAKTKYQLSQTKTDVEIRAFAEAARTADTVLSAHPEAVFEALGKTHTSLHKALQSNETDFSEVWKQLSALAAEAGKLKAALEAMKKEKSEDTKAAGGKS